MSRGGQGDEPPQAPLPRVLGPSLAPQPAACGAGTAPGWGTGSPSEAGQARPQCFSCHPPAGRVIFALHIRQTWSHFFLFTLLPLGFSSPHPPHAAGSFLQQEHPDRPGQARPSLSQARGPMPWPCRQPRGALGTPPHRGQPQGLGERVEPGEEAEESRPRERGSGMWQQRVSKCTSVCVAACCGAWCDILCSFLAQEGTKHLSRVSPCPGHWAGHNPAEREDVSKRVARGKPPSRRSDDLARLLR